MSDVGCWKALESLGHPWKRGDAGGNDDTLGFDDVAIGECDVKTRSVFLDGHNLAPIQIG